MPKLTVSDHALILIKAGLNGVPTIGGVIASLISDYVPLSTQRSMERATELLQQKLISLGDRIDVSMVDKDQFSDLFKSCYLVIVRTTQESKLRAAAALLANLMLKEGDSAKAPYSELDHLIRCVDGLSIGAMSTLAIARAIVHRSNITPDAHGNWTFRFEDLRSDLVNVDLALLMGLLSELNALNLVRIEGRPSIAMPEYGNYPLSLTPLGARFVDRFINS